MPVLQLADGRVVVSGAVQDIIPPVPDNLAALYGSRPAVTQVFATELDASAYATAQALAHVPDYAKVPDDSLPANLVKVYLNAGGTEITLKFAALGWLRGRGLSMCDPVVKMPKYATYKLPHKRQLTVHLLRDLWDPKTGEIGGSKEDPWIRITDAGPVPGITAQHGDAAKARRDNTPPPPPPELVMHRPDDVVLTPKVIASIDKELRATMRELMPTHEYQGRTWGAVKRTLRLRYRTSGEHTFLIRDLDRMMAWVVPAAPKVQTLESL